MRTALAVLAIATVACGSTADADGTVGTDTPAAAASQATVDDAPPTTTNLQGRTLIDVESDRACRWAADATGGDLGTIARGPSAGTLEDGRVVVGPDAVRPSDALIGALKDHGIYTDGSLYNLAKKCLPPITGLAAERHVIDWETGERFPLPDDVDLDDLGPQPDQLDSAS